MAIQFNPSALSAFTNVDFGADDAIANLGDNNNLVQNGNRGLGVLAKFRSGATKDSNNAVRTELLKALGQAFNIDGVDEHQGKTTFSREFMDRLEQILGPAAFKRADYELKDGAVASGKPLTQRRIQAVCNAAMDYAQRAKLDKKFEDVSSLLNGVNISGILGDDRDEGWGAKLNNWTELAAKIHHAALSLVEDGDTATVLHNATKIEFVCAGGTISANVTIGDVTRNIALNTTQDELCIAMNDTLFALYDSFPEIRDGNTTYGRAALASEALGTYMDSTPDEELDTKNHCLLRDFASNLLIAKAGVTDAEIATLTNREVLDFARKLCKTNDAQSVKNAIVCNQTFKDISGLLDGKSIGEIVGDDRTEGWETRVDTLAVFAAKLQQASKALQFNGDSATVELGALKIELTLSNSRIQAQMTAGVSTRKSIVPEDAFSQKMADAINGLYDSFTEKKDGDLTFGRAALSGKLLAYYKDLSKDCMDNQANCPLRKYASSLLMSKARVTDVQIAKLTNRQLEDYTVMLCQAGDASGIKDVIASALEEEE